MSYLVAGAINPDTISKLISKHSHKTGIGAHDFFLGQVRADSIDGKTVTGIEYSAYGEMADKVIDEIKEEAFGRYEITCAHVYHSLGWVPAGSLCFMVFTSSPHRKASREASAFLVDQIKSRAPIFGKEVFEDHSHSWKVNR